MINAGIAQLVEHHVANVNVASSSLVSRSKHAPGLTSGFFLLGNSERLNQRLLYLVKYQGWVAEW